MTYVEPVRWLVGQLKFNGQRHLARPLAHLLADRIIDANISRPDALIPVPLHTAGYRRRGFNQAELIARPIGTAIDRPLWTDCVVRSRDTTPQHELTAARRAGNVRGAFECRRRVDDRHIAVVDDVVTTAHTAGALADALIDAGAARVDVYCVARA